MEWAKFLYLSGMQWIIMGLLLGLAVKPIEWAAMGIIVGLMHLGPALWLAIKEHSESSHGATKN